MTNYRDGQVHQIGPITLQLTGLTQWGPSGIATIAAREGVNFKLDESRVVGGGSRGWRSKRAALPIPIPGALHDEDGDCL